MISIKVNLRGDGSVIIPTEIPANEILTKIKNGESVKYDLTFRGHASFNGAAFGYDAIFKKAWFCGKANFIETKFSKSANFKEATFLDNASFESAMFSENFSLEGAIFFK